MTYLEVPKDVFRKLGGKFMLRLVCEVEGKLSFPCALMPAGGGAACVFISKARLKALGASVGSRLSATVRLDKSRYGMAMPEELQETLRQDRDGQRRFDALTPGKQRNIIHFVASAKNEEARVDRAVTVIGRLKRLRSGDARAFYGLFRSGPDAASAGAGDDDLGARLVPSGATG